MRDCWELRGGAATIEDVLELLGLRIGVDRELVVYLLVAGAAEAPRMVGQMLVRALCGLARVALPDVALVAHVPRLVLLATVGAHAHQSQDRPDVLDALQG